MNDNWCVSTTYKEYGYSSATACHATEYLLAPLFELAGAIRDGMRVLDVGCGNGYLASKFIERGCRVVGLDLSEQGISIARMAHPKGRFEVFAADMRVLQNLGEEPFDLVISTEVVEHLMQPREYAAGCFAALKPGGKFVCSTPFHGYWKNLALALTNKFDFHANPLWDGGHIKLWSRKTLSALLTEMGFVDLQFRGAGRVPYLWKSMVMSGTKPANPIDGGV